MDPNANLSEQSRLLSSYIKAHTVLTLPPEALTSAYPDDTDMWNSADAWEAIRVMARGDNPAAYGLPHIVYVTSVSRGLDRVRVIR